MPGPGSDGEVSPIRADARFLGNLSPGNAQLLAVASVPRGVRQIAEEVADPIDRLGDRLKAVGIGEADIILAERAKAGPGYRRHPGLVEQPALKAASIMAGAGDVGEGVERAAGPGTADSGRAV